MKMATKRGRKNREAGQDSAHVAIESEWESSSSSSEKHEKKESQTQPKTQPKTQLKPKYNYRLKVRIPSNLNAKWIKKCRLPKKNLFKYAIKDALDTLEVSPDDFSIKLKRFKATLSDDELVNAFYRAGFAQRYNLKKRMQFVSHVMNVPTEMSPKKDSRSKRPKLQLSPSPSPSPPQSPSANPSPSPPQSPSVNPIPSPPQSPSVNPIPSPPQSPSANPSPSARQSPLPMPIIRVDSRDMVEIAMSEAKMLMDCIASMVSLKLEELTPCLVALSQRSRIRKLVNWIENSGTSLVGPSLVR